MSTFILTILGLIELSFITLGVVIYLDIRKSDKVLRSLERSRNLEQWASIPDRKS